MDVLHGLDARPAEPRPTVVTIGTFDGVHRGHAALHARLVSEARALDAVPAVVTFDRHPLETVAPEKAPCRLSTLGQRLSRFADEGIELTLVLPFTNEVSELSAEAFVQRTLADGLGARKVIIGEDFRFGHDRTGDIGLLRTLGRRLGFEVDAMDLVPDGGSKISSSTVRRLIGEGDVEGAAALLGHSYRLAGVVAKGEGRGRGIGFPTANLKPHERACLPGLGVYAGWWVEEGRRLPGVINVGVRPTFTPDPAPVIEIHVFDIDEDLYGLEAEIEFTQRLRDEEKFPSVDALVEQIHRDAAEARGALGA